MISLTKEGGHEGRRMNRKEVLAAQKRNQDRKGGTESAVNRENIGSGKEKGRTIAEANKSKRGLPTNECKQCEQYEAYRQRDSVPVYGL